MPEHDSTNPNILRAGIAVDDWKLPIFKKILTENGYTYEDKGTLGPNMSLLIVNTTDIVKLGTVVQSCQNAARASRMN